MEIISSLGKVCMCHLSYFWSKGVKRNESIKNHVAGIDVHKEMLAITTLIGEPESDPVAEHFSCQTFTARTC